MLINLSNHPSANWSQEQLDAAGKYGKIVDLPFPNIDPGAETEEIVSLAKEYVQRIKKLVCENFLPAVHIMGELTFCFALVSFLHEEGVTCLASTTTRQTADFPDGTKTSRFEFVRFREYRTEKGIYKGKTNTQSK